MTEIGDSLSEGQGIKCALVTPEIFLCHTQFLSGSLTCISLLLTSVSNFYFAFDLKKF